MEAPQYDTSIMKCKGTKMIKQACTKHCHEKNMMLSNTKLFDAIQSNHDHKKHAV